VVVGSGAALSSATLMQDRVHFEVEVIKPGAPRSAPPHAYRAAAPLLTRHSAASLASHAQAPSALG